MPKPATAPKPAQEIETTFTAHIMRLVGELVQANPDRSNSGKVYGEAYIWETLERVAKKKREALWESMEKDGLVSTIPSDPGSYELGMSNRFVASVRVSEPVRRFNADELCKLLTNSKYKVPAPIAKEFVDKAKLPSTSSTTKKIMERNTGA
jgi:hypothetical protein